MITSAQIAEARALLKWSHAELAQRALITTVTVQRAEKGRDHPPIPAATLAAIRAALENGGVEFLEKDEQPNIKLRKIKR